MRAASKLTEWKVVYDALEAARAALKHAIATSAPNDEIAELRARAQRLRRRSDAALDELNAELAAMRSCRKLH
jgi:Flp pilus assembly protein TadD